MFLFFETKTGNPSELLTGDHTRTVVVPTPKTGGIMVSLCAREFLFSSIVLTLCFILSSGVHNQTRDVCWLSYNSQIERNHCNNKNSDLDFLNFVIVYFKVCASCKLKEAEIYQHGILFLFLLLL
jgi:hypothetical protein